MEIKSLFQKWWVWLLLSVFSLFLIAAVFISHFFNPWLQEKLETSVHQQTKGLYTLRLHGLDTSLFGGRISVDSLHIIPDFDAWQDRTKAGKSDTAEQEEAPRTLLDLKTRSLVISGVNFLGIVRGKPLDVSKLEILNPILVITQMRQDTARQQQSLHESLQGIAKDLQIDRIEIVDGTLKVRKGKDAKEDMIALEDFTIKVSQMRLDSTSFLDESRAYYASNMALEAGKAEFLLPDGTYRLQASGLNANTADGTLNIGNLQLVPLLKNAELARRRGMAVSTLNLKVPEINASGVDYRAHSRYNNLAASHVVIMNPSLSTYMDRKHFSPKGNKPLPHDMVQDLQTGLNLQKIEVKGMHIRYEELAPQAVETGVITFNNLYATITNISNDKKRMSAKTPAVIDAKTSINGVAPVAFKIRLDLLDPNGYHTIHGTAGPANPATLNPILEPTTFISIKEGKLQKSDFKIVLHRNKATGNLNVRYTDFKVDVLTKDEDKRQSFGKKVLSKIANKIVITSDNPKEGKELRPGEINVVRARSRSVLNYWKDCLVSGFRSAAGIEGIGANLQDPNR
ncbi:hypothetical protein H9Q13_02735 [Pontibacter sp. JH31]|uniref:Uncharacterized protein n=1 Tax=Pontibacter aquaedesilientis TaxID=2766980 RepID=A0ABR7XCP3_9BACT|nr:hypothetical protein [Pontibacter aquaedesilientis]MBD1396069.1 hypothetical protein [Pontibacter aquaedesilientis]